MSWMNSAHPWSGNFKLSAFLTDHKEVLFPVSDTQMIAVADEIEVSINEMHSIISFEGDLDDGTIVTLVPAEQLTPGAMVVLMMSASSEGAISVTVDLNGSTMDVDLLASQSVVMLLTGHSNGTFVLLSSTYNPDPAYDPTMAVDSIASAAGVVAFTVATVKHMVAITDTLTALTTLNATVTGCPDGADLYVVVSTNGTEKVVFGTGFATGDFTYAASSKYYLHFVFRNGEFILVSRSKV